MALRVMAVAAPELPEGDIGGAFTSRDPASLYNACRYGAFLADQGIGVWGDSNWAVPRLKRRESVLLLHSLKEELPLFIRKLEEIQPNLLLIGAMTLCLPGAIACATIAKDVLGDQVCTVLGGRHTSESMYLSLSGEVIHHPSSPLRLMVEKYLPPCFDIVVAGEGEHIISWLGERIDSLDHKGVSPSRVSSFLNGIHNVRGEWILGWYNEGDIITVRGNAGVVDRNALPAPCEMFGIQTLFDVFGGRLTAHVFSDTGSGCVYDCSFCSERRSTTGGLAQLDTGPQRLFHQLSAAVQVIADDTPTQKASAFVEDSIILGGSISGLNQLVHLLERNPLDIRFGGQLTVDQVLRREEILSRLKTVGFDYLFIGIETLDPKEIGGMSKDVGTALLNWSTRIEEVLETLAKHEISCGAGLLFGLGESSTSREQLFQHLKDWRKHYDMPNPISMNWAVQHPLRGDEGGAGNSYTEWGIPVGPYLEAFRGFGEASVLYPIVGQTQPTLEEVYQVQNMYRDLLGEI